MEDNFYKDEFEVFLKEQADSHRIYPSDGLWRSIDKKLHGEKTWPALTFAAILILFTTVAICVHFAPKPNIFAYQPNNNLPQNAATAHLNKNKNVSTFQLADNTPFIKSTPWKNNTLITSNNQPIQAKDNKTSKHIALSIPGTDEQRVLSIIPNVVPANNIASPIAENYFPNNETPLSNQLKNGSGTIELASAENTITDDVLMANNLNIRGKTITANDNNTANLQSLLPPNRVKKNAGWKNRFSYQVYITPSVSYRRLGQARTDDKDKTEGPMALNLTANVNQIVRHKPGNGLEAGFGLMYNITPTIKIKSGVQFNVRQYYIEAYKALSEATSIAISSGRGYDTISSVSIYRTGSGYQDAEITNRYFQVAIPLGLDWQVFGNKQIRFNVGGSVQPTYQLNANAFLLTNNFKNYTQTNDMLQRWNLNSTIEAYLSFKVGNANWQVGPQIRYQHLPTMIPEYPIKENLLDYGIKIGVSKPLH